MHMYSKLLVPVDFSSHSRTALAHALSLAGQFGASVDVLHVAEVPVFLTDPSVAVATPSGSQSLREYALGEAKAGLQTFLESSSADDRAKLSLHVEAGRPRDVILDRARHGSYDLIVMGTHGRTGRAHSFAGSVAESIVRAAPCPVLTVRESD